MSLSCVLLGVFVFMCVSLCLVSLLCSSVPLLVFYSMSTPSIMFILPCSRAVVSLLSPLASSVSLCLICHSCVFVPLSFLVYLSSLFPSVQCRDLPHGCVFLRVPLCVLSLVLFSRSAVQAVFLSQSPAYESSFGSYPVCFTQPFHDSFKFKILRLYLCCII